VTESRASRASLFLDERESESEDEIVPRHTPREFLDPRSGKVAPISLAKCGNGWRKGSISEDNSTATQPLCDNSFGRVDGQKTRDMEPSESGNDLSPISSLHREAGKEIDALHKNGGKSCHPKMRAKYMFRSGDLETCSWGYDWSSSDNESVKAYSPIANHSKPCVPYINGPQNDLEVKPVLKRTYSDISEASDEHDVEPKRACDSEVYASRIDWNTFDFTAQSVLNVGNTKSSTGPNCMYLPAFSPLSDPFDKTTPCSDQDPVSDVLACGTVDHEETITDDDSDQTILDQTTNTDFYIADPETPFTPVQLDMDADNSRTAVRCKNVTTDDVYVAEVTCDDVTVVFQECHKPKGFFQWRD